MPGEHLAMRARRVVAGRDPRDRSTVIEDRDTPTRVATDAYIINQIWQMDALPPDVLGEDASGGSVTIAPPRGGFIYLVTTFPPDSEWDVAAGYRDALAASGAADSYVEGEEIAGLHETDTVDLNTVISGELYAVLEEGEVLLRAGDSFVQRGTRHASSNRTDRPARSSP